MGGRALRPPMLASALLRLSLPKGVERDSILGDFWELHRHRAQTGSSIMARLWYRNRQRRSQVENSERINRVTVWANGQLVVNVVVRSRVMKFAKSVKGFSISSHLKVALGADIGVGRNRHKILCKC